MDYNDKLKLAKEALDSGSYDKETVEYIFPELKESEDEKIRKWLIPVVDRLLGTIDCPFGCDKVLAWLEKQGEQNPQGESALETVKEEKVDNQNCVKPIDKVEPKFKAGDWIVFNGLTLYVKEVVEGFYRTISKGGIPSSYGWDIDNAARLWTIQDAKEGDVLSWDDSKCIALFKNIYDEDSFNSYGFVGHFTGTFELRQSYHDIKGAHPATKEQRDTLLKAMTDAGYTFDFEKKELKKIEPKFKVGDTIRLKNGDGLEWTVEEVLNNGYYTIICADKDDFIQLDDNWELVEQKPTWSEEEKKRIDRIIDVLDWAEDKGRISYSDWEDYVTYVRCLSPQPNIKWYKLDDNMQKKIINYFECQREIEPTRKDILNTWIDWLKSIRPQKQNITNKDFEDIIREIKTRIDQCNGFNRKHREEVFNLLDSLRHHNTWKPSEEHLKNLKQVINCDINGWNKNCLEDLYNRLKEL